MAMRDQQESREYQVTRGILETKEMLVTWENLDRKEQSATLVSLATEAPKALEVSPVSRALPAQLAPVACRETEGPLE